MKNFIFKHLVCALIILVTFSSNSFGKCIGSTHQFVIECKKNICQRGFLSQPYNQIESWKSGRTGICPEVLTVPENFQIIPISMPHSLVKEDSVMDGIYTIYCGSRYVDPRKSFPINDDGIRSITCDSPIRPIIVANSKSLEMVRDEIIAKNESEQFKDILDQNLDLSHMLVLVMGFFLAFVIFKKQKCKIFLLLSLISISIIFVRKLWFPSAFYYFVFTVTWLIVIGIAYIYKHLRKRFSKV